jgi:hypothetical protein
MNTTNTIPVERKYAHSYAYGYLLGSIKSMGIVLKTRRDDPQALVAEIDFLIERARALDAAMTKAMQSDSDIVEI